jgi:hypothetical protein
MGSIIHIHNAISLARKAQNINYVGGAQTIISTLKIINTSNVHKSYNKNPIMKLGLFGHNSLEYCAYLSSSCPCAIIPMRIMGNCPSLDAILLYTCNLGSAIFA